MEYRHKNLYELFFGRTNFFIDLFAMGIGVAFLAGLTHLKIPMWPVPITGQTLGVFMIAFFFGFRKGLMTILAYLLVGLTGLGVFAAAAGAEAFIGPTAGYLLGFAAMVFYVGYMVEKGYGRTRMSVLKCMLVGEVILYLFGLTGLWIFLGNVGLWKILTLGFIPFIVGDAIKILIAMELFPFLFKQGEKMRG